MLILITYDVETTTVEGRKRLRQVARECVNYGHRVQNSVFECVLTEAQFIVLREKLKKLIDNSTDSIRFYFLGNNWERHIESIGLDRSLDTNSASQQEILTLHETQKRYVIYASANLWHCIKTAYIRGFINYLIFSQFTKK